MMIPHSDYQQLYQRFLAKQLPCRYEVGFVKQYFYEKYDAISLDSKLFPELAEDDFFNDELQTHVYAIVKADAVINHSDRYSRICAVEEGTAVYIFFQSRLDLIDCDFFSLHGQSDCIEKEMIIFNGIDPRRAKPENPEFQHYLEVLAEMGHI